MRAFLEEVGRSTDYDRLDLLEKDVLLHRALSSIAGNSWSREGLLFKGGTCLMKGYLGYYRFSEDLDFTWRNQSEMASLSGTGLRERLSTLITELGKNIEDMSKDLDIDFRCRKKDRRYFEYGGSGRTTTLKVWYDSEILGGRSFFKIQVNFVEDLIYQPRRRSLSSLISAIDTSDLKRFFPEETSMYSKALKLTCYDPKEIMAEKVRAILTRQGIKARDFIDIHLIEKDIGCRVSDLMNEIIRKMRFSLDHYQKYRRNLEEKRPLIREGKLFEWGRERELLLRDIDEADLYRSVDRCHDLFPEILSRMER